MKLRVIDRKTGIRAGSNVPSKSNFTLKIKWNRRKNWFLAIPNRWRSKLRKLEFGFLYKFLVKYLLSLFTNQSRIPWELWDSTRLRSHCRLMYPRVQSALSIRLGTVLYQAVYVQRSYPSLHAGSKGDMLLLIAYWPIKTLIIERLTDRSVRVEETFSRV